MSDFKRVGVLGGDSLDVLVDEVITFSTAGHNVTRRYETHCSY